MDDENEKDDDNQGATNQGASNQGASTSKETKERKDDDDYEEGEHDGRSYSGSSASYYSDRSRAQKDAEIHSGKEDRHGLKGEERKKGVRRGRVTKPRRRSGGRKRNKRVRRGITRKRRVSPKQARSASTVYTKLSSSIGSRCTRCGHRCCGRRSKRDNKTNKNEQRQNAKKITKKLKKDREMEAKKEKRNLNHNARDRKKTKERTKAKPKDKILRAEQQVQTDSQSKMLSPLLISTNATLADDGIPQEEPHCLEITPDMIYETIQNLTKWKQNVPFESILKYMKLHYPVNPNVEELTEELSYKLIIATIVGIILESVSENNVHYWSIAGHLMRKGPTKNHVSLFWRIYLDTMAPVYKRIEKSNESPLEERKQLKVTSACCKNEPHLPECFNQYLWPAPCVCQIKSGCMCPCTGYVCSTQSKTPICSSRLYFQRSCKSFKRYKRSKPRTPKSRSSHQRSEHRFPLRGILKSKPSFQKSHKCKSTRRMIKLQPTVYDFEHKNSLHVIRKWQQSQNISDSENKYIQDIQQSQDLKHNLKQVSKTNKAIKIRDSISSVHEHLKETGSMKSRNEELEEDTKNQKEMVCNNKDSYLKIHEPIQKLKTESKYKSDQDINIDAKTVGTRYSFNHIYNYFKKHSPIKLF